MIDAEKIIERYGEVMSVNGSSVKGFVCPMNYKGGRRASLATPVGVKNRARYLVMTTCELSPEGNDSIVFDGREYRTLRAEAFYFMGKVSHYEAVAEGKNA